MYHIAGYTCDFDIIEKTIPIQDGDHFNLYKWVFPPDVQPSTLAMIGYVKTIGGKHPTYELQARWAARFVTTSSQYSFFVIFLEDLNLVSDNK